MGDTKFCTDCKHFIPSYTPRGLFRAPKISAASSKCGRKLSLVTGGPDGAEYCDLERESFSPTRCGPEGRFWAPRDV